MQAPNSRPLLVVKIGGSLHGSPDLRRRWIDALRRWPHRLTLVAGGGPFADAVRAVQSTMRYSDEAAHAMATLAMEQYALALASLHGLTLAASREEIDAAHAHGRIALWRASRMVSAATEIPPGWDVTSDSLAAWLARGTGASALLVVKSRDVDADCALQDIAAAGVVDAAFPRFIGATPLFIAGPQALADAGALLAVGAPPGVRVKPETQKMAS